jgi:hypothetical protein
MRKTIFFSCFVLFVFAFHAVAQDAPKASEPSQGSETSAHYYHLELVVQELSKEGKPTNSRTYTTTVGTRTRESASIRADSRIPIVTGSSAALNSALVNTQFQYQDVGVNIDVQPAHEIGRQLSFDLKADITSVAENLDARLHEPIIRQNKWQSTVLIPIGKPTVVFTSDALDSKGSMQLVVTATLLQ